MLSAGLSGPVAATLAARLDAAARTLRAQVGADVGADQVERDLVWASRRAAEAQRG